MKISIYIAISANGLISNSRSTADWLSPEYGAGFYSICQRTNAVIMGKTTYNILSPDYLPLKEEGTTVVLSRDEQARSDNPTVVFTKSKAIEIVEMLSGRGHSEAVIIGGAETIRAFINAQLVDDIFFVMEPRLFGTGLPLLKNVEAEARLRLQELRKLNDHTILLHYTIVKEQ